MKAFYRISILALFMAAVSSCNTDTGTLLPNITGSSGEVIIVIEEADWQGSIGKELQNILTRPVNGLPQYETLFNLINVSPGGFAKIFHSHRNIIFVRKGSQYTEPGITVEENKWAASQLILNVQAANDEALLALLNEKGSMLAEKINVTERERWMSYYKRFLNSPSFTRLSEDHGIRLYVPNSFVMDVNEDDFVWLSYETPTTTQAVLVHHFPYEDRSIFNQESLMEIRNNLTKEKVKGPDGKAYMTIEEIMPVEFNQFQYKNRMYAEIRGLWTLEGGFMGGPFVTLFTIDEGTNRVFMLDAFVYAPKDKKRELLRQTESILYTVRFDSEVVKTN